MKFPIKDGGWVNYSEYDWTLKEVSILLQAVTSPGLKEENVHVKERWSPKMLNRETADKIWTLWQIQNDRIKGDKEKEEPVLTYDDILTILNALEDNMSSDTFRHSDDMDTLFKAYGKTLWAKFRLWQLSTQDPDTIDPEK